jgi:hypothetical protein
VIAAHLDPQAQQALEVLLDYPERMENLDVMVKQDLLAQLDPRANEACPVCPDFLDPRDTVASLVLMEPREKSVALEKRVNPAPLDLQAPLDLLVLLVAEERGVEMDPRAHLE